MLSVEEFRSIFGVSESFIAAGQRGQKSLRHPVCNSAIERHGVQKCSLRGAFLQNGRALLMILEKKDGFSCKKCEFGHEYTALKFFKIAKTARIRPVF